MSTPTHDILSDTEQRILAAKAKAGDQDAAARLIAHHQRIVYQVARRREFMAGAHELEDLVQWGNIGLLEAIRKFDPKYKNTFFTYATWWVKASIARFCYKNEHTASIPIRHAQRLQRARYERSQLYQKNGTEPTSADLADHLGYDRAELAALFQAVEPVSWDVARDASDRPIDELVDPDEVGVEDAVMDGLAARTALEFIETALDACTRQIILDHFGFNGRPLSYQELGRKYGLSEAEVIAKVRGAIAEIRKLVDTNT